LSRIAGGDQAVVRALVVSEFYPRRADPVLGVWAHRQALATARAGVEVEVVVLHRLAPPLAALRDGPRVAARALARQLRQPTREVRDGLTVHFAPFLAPPRPDFYPYWGAWSAASLAVAVRRLRRSFAFDVVHAHNAVPTADAVRRVIGDVPLLVSVHGGDVLHTAPATLAGTRAVTRSLVAARRVLANSAGTAALAQRYGARTVDVVHLGADLPDLPDLPDPHPGRTAGATATDAAVAVGAAGEGEGDSLVTVGHLVARKRHADVIGALALLRDRYPALRYVVIGDGPERDTLARTAAALGVGNRVELRGQLEPLRAAAEAQRCTLFAMPSTEEAFGVAYIEAMAAGLPAIGARGEPGPEEIARVGDGMALIDAGNVTALADCIDALLRDRAALAALGARAQDNVRNNFSWQQCGLATRAAYSEALS
jgi:glycosyltransferase involved in cell wall biosynthesis